MAKTPVPRKKPLPVPKEQWDMPASLSADGSRMASLRELVDSGTPTLSLGQLSQDQFADVVAKRIEAQPKFELQMIGAGKIDKKRAVAEVKAQTEIGRTLMEIERNLIDDMVQRAEQK
jgi:hypothetical protein